MTSDDMYRALLDELLPKVNSWADAYAFFGSLLESAREAPGPLGFVNAAFTMYAFMLAMKENPEEGDIKALISCMCRIISHEGEQKLGATFRMLSEEELRTHVAETVVSAAAESLKNSLLAQWDSEKPKGTIH